MLVGHSTTTLLYRSKTSNGQDKKVINN
jgi:hypothetical protein